MHPGMASVNPEFNPFSHRLDNLDDVIQGLADTPPVPVAMRLLPAANAIENHQP